MKFDIMLVITTAIAVCISTKKTATYWISEYAFIWSSSSRFMT